ncbi:unnamed protein product [Lampetra planeri]
MITRPLRASGRTVEEVPMSDELSTAALRWRVNPQPATSAMRVGRVPLRAPASSGDSAELTRLDSPRSDPDNKQTNKALDYGRAGSTIVLIPHSLPSVSARHAVILASQRPHWQATRRPPRLLNGF